MKKVLVWSSAAIILLLISFFVYGFWPRVDVKMVHHDAGIKYRTIEEVNKDVGRAHLFRKVINEKGEELNQYIYFDRFLFPSGSAMLWCDHRGNITYVDYKRKTGMITAFPEQSPFFVITVLEFALKNKSAK